MPIWTWHSGKLTSTISQKNIVSPKSMRRSSCPRVCANFKPISRAQLGVVERAMIKERRKIERAMEVEEEKQREREAAEQEKIRKAFDQAFHKQISFLINPFLYSALLHNP